MTVPSTKLSQTSIGSVNVPPVPPPPQVRAEYVLIYIENSSNMATTKEAINKSADLDHGRLSSSGYGANFTPRSL